MSNDQHDPQQWINQADIALWSGNYNEGDIGAIAKSITKFGFNQALRLWNGECRAGNHSLMALRGLKEQGKVAPVGILVSDSGDWFVRYLDISHLTEAEALAFAIADNRMAALASHDEALLTDYLSQLSQMDTVIFEATGFDDDDLNQRLRDLELPEGFTEYTEDIENDVQYITCPKCGEKFPK